MGAWTPPPPPDGAAAAGPLKLVTRPLKGRKARPVRYLVEGKIALGKLSCIAGVGGMGKSTLIRHLIARLTTGRPAFGLDYEPPPAGDVLLVSVEDAPEDTLIPHLIAEGADLGRVHTIEGVEKPDGQLLQFDLRDLEAVRERLRAEPGIRLLIIDPVMSFVGRAGINENASAEVRTLLDPLLDLARDHQVAVLLIANLNKSTAVAAVNRIVGSSAFRDGCRCVYAVGTDPNDPDRRVLALVKENLPGLDRRSVTFARADLADGDLARVLAADEFSDLDAGDRDKMARQVYVLCGFRSEHLDADAALGTGRRADAEGGGGSSRDCAGWLQDRLGTQYAWPDEEVQRDAVAAGFSVRQYRRGKDKLRPGLCSAPPGWGMGWLIAMGPVRDKIIRPAELGGQTGQTQSFSGENGHPQSAHPPGGGQTDDPILADLRREP